MAYCLATDVERRFPECDFTTLTTVTTSDVEAWIDINTAEIDGRLEDAYTTPITGTKSLLIVKKICEFMTMADVEEVLAQKGIGEDKQKKTMAERHRDAAEKMLKAIEDGLLALPDAESISSSSFANSNVDGSVTAVMKKDTRQW
jgi:phage gp36-like protein